MLVMPMHRRRFRDWTPRKLASPWESGPQAVAAPALTPPDARIYSPPHASLGSSVSDHRAPGTTATETHTAQQTIVSQRPQHDGVGISLTVPASLGLRPPRDGGSRPHPPGRTQSPPHSSLGSSYSTSSHHKALAATRSGGIHNTRQMKQPANTAR